MKSILAVAALGLAALPAASIQASEMSSPRAAIEAPAVAAPPPARLPPVPPGPSVEDMMSSPFWQAYLAAATELAAVIDRRGDVKQGIARIEGFEFSPETKRKLGAVFGNDAPLHVRKTAFTDDHAQLDFTLDGLDYLNAKDGGQLHTAPLTGTAVYSRRYTHMRFDAAMPDFTVEDGKAMRAAGSDFSIASEGTRGPGGLWFGTETFRLGHLTMAGTKTSGHATVDGVVMKTEVRRRGNRADIYADMNVAAVDWGSDALGPVHMAFRLPNLDLKGLLAISDKAKKTQAAKQTEAERVAAAKAMLGEVGGVLLKQGAALEIQDVSVRYHGLTAGLDGRVTVGSVLGRQVELPKVLADKVAARVNLRVPMELALTIFRAVTRESLAAKAKCCRPVQESDVDAAARAGLEKALARLSQEKFVRVEGGDILSTIEFGKGKLLVNGRPIRVPGDPRPAPAVPLPRP